MSPFGKRSPALEAARRTRILQGLASAYPNARCALDHRNAFELLVATILSAQSTDKLVNQITPALFAKYPTPAELAAATLPEIEQAVKQTGFFHNKAKSLKGCAEALVRIHGGNVPQTMEELIDLPGVGRKTANVVLGTAFGKNLGVVVDTHVQRLSQRLGLTKEQTSEKIEQELMRVVPQGDWTIFSHRTIQHGRQVCSARAPKCDICAVAEDCPSRGLDNSHRKGK
jgi:endonuclease-3